MEVAITMGCESTEILHPHSVVRVLNIRYDQIKAVFTVECRTCNSLKQYYFENSSALENFLKRPHTLLQFRKKERKVCHGPTIEY